MFNNLCLIRLNDVVTCTAIICSLNSTICSYTGVARLSSRLERTFTPYPSLYRAIIRSLKTTILIYCILTLFTLICQLGSVVHQLPNISAHCDIGGTHSREVTSTRAPFSLRIFSSNNTFQMSKNTSYDLVTFDMDLSTVNSVWKNNARVRPDSRSCRFFIRYM